KQTAHLGFSGLFALFDQLPKLARLAQLIVFRHRKFAAEKKIPQRVLVEHAMHGHSFGTALEIDSIILRAISMKFFPFALDDAETIGVKIVEVFGKNLKLGQQFEL